jgi:hypothetical protein
VSLTAWQRTPAPRRLPRPAPRVIRVSCWSKPTCNNAQSTRDSHSRAPVLIRRARRGERPSIATDTDGRRAHHHTYRRSHPAPFLRTCCRLRAWLPRPPPSCMHTLVHAHSHAPRLPVCSARCRPHKARAAARGASSLAAGVDARPHLTLARPLRCKWTRLARAAARSPGPASAAPTRTPLLSAMSLTTPSPTKPAHQPLSAHGTHGKSGGKKGNGRAVGDQRAGAPSWRSSACALGPTCSQAAGICRATPTSTSVTLANRHRTARKPRHSVGTLSACTQ